MSSEKAQRRLGPFTGRQLTAIIVAIVIAVGLPTGAYASGAFTSVVVQDPVSGAQANVTPAGQLQVAPAAPSTLFQVTSFLYGNASSWGTSETVPPPGDALVVTGLHIDTFRDPSGSEIYLYLMQGNCGTLVNEDGIGYFEMPLTPLTLGEEEFPLDTGLVVPSGDSLCAEYYNQSSALTVSGYTIPAAAG